MLETKETGLSMNGSWDVSAAYGGKTVRLRAYYGGEHYRTSNTFVIGPTNVEFATQPSSGALNESTQTYPITWETNFTPIRVELVDTHGSSYSSDYTLLETKETGLSMNGSWDVSAAYGGKTVCLRAYYGGAYYRTSRKFVIGPTNAEFVTQPAAGAMKQLPSSYPITWETNFTPIRVELVDTHGSSYSSDYTLLETKETGLSMNGSWDVSAAYGGKTVRLRAYYGGAYYRTSNKFVIGPENPKFVSQPVTGALIPSN